MSRKVRRARREAEKAREFRLGIKIIMLWTGGLILFGVLYVHFNTHIDVMTIKAHVPRYSGSVYKIRTDGVTLNVSRWYEDELIAGHTYRIKWVNGIVIDRILKYVEVVE